MRHTTRQLRLQALEDRTVPSFDFGSAFHFGSTSFDVGLDIATDAAGDVYISGYYSGTVDFDPNGTNPSSNHVLTNSNDFEGFAAKYLADGTFQWATDLGTGGWAAIAVQGANAYVGYSSWIGNTGGPYNTVVSQLNAADGAIAWTTSLASNTPERSVDVAVDASGSVYATANNSSGQAFVSKLDAAGTVLWSSASSGGSAVGRGIAVDAAGNTFTTGGYTGAVTFGTTGLTSWSGTQDAFVWKLDASGTSVAAISLGSNGDDVAYGIAADSSGSAIVHGQWGLNGANVSRNNDFDPGSSVLKLSNKGNYDVFVEKLNASLQLTWVKSVGGTGIDFGRGVTVDGAGNIYTTGSFTGTVDFDPGPKKYNLAGYGNRDIFISKLNGTGNFVAAAAMGGTAADDGSAVALDGVGNVWSTGGFRGTADFDPTAGTYNLTQDGYPPSLIYDAYVSKLTQSGMSALAGGSSEKADLNWQPASAQLGESEETILHGFQMDIYQAQPDRASRNLIDSLADRTRIDRWIDWIIDLDLNGD